uniref:Large ribosomal subunit protein uL14c n=5 Tax=Gnetum TaxID=3380 RepID=RK14_GNEPA|nr:ribosomal protein L14 [Gnetum parvifolium]YP_008082229.1 ribosomal protein L14 [Gnetum montanum]YP_009117879.1 ribosomal protein L14 [Gnetum gnemon]A6BM44.1 RecName: Full=Large ribosomal subunit protein uL14c; AltName: Full=50S ribosomal protein L14, chloroplastic [Gnetum parvifolium]ANZ54134.1 ribosomal protein L14 [Gnetum pendulum]AGL11075.1 ribosomal protein L14 [Gnetum montanum]AJE71506.1 ribosomal protein L14 [Gnetum gnemon]ALK01083.1 ribosomal protein L14 [Gnetum gnemon]ANZ53672.1 
MIQSQTFLNIADNSGARKIMCIRVVGTTYQKYAYIGDIIIAIIKEVVPNTKMEKSEIVRAVVIRTSKEFQRDDGMRIRSDDNAAIIIDQKGNPKGTRVFGPVLQELRQWNFTKIISLAPEVL